MNAMSEIAGPNVYQKEYIHRVNKVCDYIEAHLDQELNLEKLAGIASFSPFHFHRIFKAFTGETPNQFIKRLRLERAGSLLLNAPEEPISHIAERCGFQSTSVFCRNFKERFSMSANDFRQTWEDPRSKNDQELSKKGQQESKNSKTETSAMDYVCHVEQIKQGGFMKNSKIQIKDMPALNLVYTRHVGDFDQIGAAYEKLMRWAGPRGLLTNPEMKTVTVYHDDPKVTDLEKVRQSACITVEGEVKTEGEFGNMELPAAKCAVGHFEVTAQEFERAWDNMCVWLSESGYQPADGFPYELYHNDHMEHPERKFIVDICIPVKAM